MSHTNGTGLHLALRGRSKHACGYLLAVPVALIFGVAAVHAQSTASAFKTCGVVSGAHWSIRGAGSGNRYLVQAEGLACSLARKWVPRLTHQRGGAGKSLKGPVGFTCTAFIPSNLAAAGACRRAGGRSFTWTVKR